MAYLCVGYVIIKNQSKLITYPRYLLDEDAVIDFCTLAFITFRLGIKG